MWVDCGVRQLRVRVLDIRDMYLRSPRKLEQRLRHKGRPSGRQGLAMFNQVPVLGLSIP